MSKPKKKGGSSIQATELSENERNEASVSDTVQSLRDMRESDRRENAQTQKLLMEQLAILREESARSERERKLDREAFEARIGEISVKVNRA